MTYCLPKQYSSTVRIEVEKSAAAVRDCRQQFSLQYFDPYYLTTQFKIITSWGILTQVITNMNLQEVFAQADQAGEPKWTMDQAYRYLFSKVSVEQTRGTSLIEITVKYPKPEEAANIANTIVAFYTKYRMESWNRPRLTGIKSLEESLSNNQAVLMVKKAELTSLISRLDMSVMGESPDTIITLSRQTMEELEMRRMKAEADYQLHFQTLTNLLALQAKGQLADAMATAIEGTPDPELTIRADQVARARDGFTAAQGLGFGPDNPNYIAAQKALQDATNAYEAKIDGIMLGLKTLVNQNSNILQYIVNKEAETKATAQKEYATNRAYVDLKGEVENLQRVVDDLSRRDVEERVE